MARFWSTTLKSILPSTRSRTTEEPPVAKRSPWASRSSRCGDRFVSRVGATILRNAGLDSLIAWSESEYIEKALVLAAQPELAAEMRTGMRALLARSTLCDCTGFTRKLEHAYRDIWRRWCALQSGA